MIHEREFFTEGNERWVVRLDRKLIGLTVVRYVDSRQEGPGILFEEYLATGTGPPHKAFRKLVESLVPETAEYEVG
jgi:hypothetical protein